VPGKDGEQSVLSERGKDKNPEMKSRRIRPCSTWVPGFYSDLENLSYGHGQKDFYEKRNPDRMDRGFRFGDAK